MTRGTRTAPTAPVAPITVGPDSAIAVLGVTWREALALARALGVKTIEVGGRRLIPAAALREALDSRAPRSEQSDDDAETSVLARLGRRGAA